MLFNSLIEKKRAGERKGDPEGIKHFFILQIECGHKLVDWKFPQIIMHCTSIS